MRALPWLLAAGLGAAAGLASLRRRTAALDVRDHLVGARLLDHADGRLYHRVVGGGPDVVMLPGFGGNSFTWHDVTPPLATRYRVHWLDLLGHGFSDKPRLGDYTAQAQARRIGDVLTPLAPGRVAVVASSAGAQPAVALAAHRPELVAGLVLIDPFLQPGRGLEAALRAASRVPRATAVVMRALWHMPGFAWLGASLGRHRP
ncbi:MAG: alpha/beta fold hydrolase, partial [Actinobacteria bacterium]|nr:alpha/beta fold hydrolase [Actinomycetota bacterium]